MPRATSRIQYPGAFNAPKELTVDDWAALEAALEQQVPKRARNKIDSLVALLMMRIPVEKNALSVVQTRKKLKSFGKQARQLRKSVWYHDTQGGLADFLAAQVAECDQNDDPHKRFQESKRNVRRNRSDSVLASLADTLDAVIVKCDLAAKNLDEPEEHVKDGFVFTCLAILLRRICEANGLPFKIRKDSDKMSDEKQLSPFLRFIDILQKRLALPRMSTDAMANRILRLEKRLVKAKAGNCRIF
jgi:hypothetical protein